MTEEAANLIVLCCTAAAGLGIPALLPQPEPISAPVWVWAASELALWRPAFSTMTGLMRAATRSELMKSRASRTPST